MEAFNSFSLTNLETIVGGELINTTYSGGDGSSGSDIYDSNNDRVIYRAE